MKAYKPTVDEVRGSVGKLVDEAEPDDPLKVDLERLNVAWDALESSSNDRKRALEDGLDKARRYKRLRDETNDWLTDAEAELEKHSGIVPLQRDALNDEIAFCDAFREKVEAQKPVLDDVHRAADDLTSPRPEDDSERRDVDSQVKELDERYDKLSAGVGVRLAALRDGLDKTGDFDKAREKFVPWLDEAERRFAELGDVDANPDRLKEQQDETQVKHQTKLQTKFYILF